MPRSPNAITVGMLIALFPLVTGESWTVIGSAIVMLAVIVPVQVRIMQDVAGLREGMARLEGLFEGFTRQETSR